MDVLVSGASGLIGTALRPALVAAGHRPIALVRRPARGADEITWDPATGRLDRAAIEGMGAAIHLAGVGIADKRWTDEQKRVLRDSRVQSTGLLARAIGELRRAAARARERVGHRVVRRSRRRDPHREERAGRGLPRRAVQDMGGRDRTGRASGHACRAHPQRHRPDTGGRRARQAAAALPTRARRPLRLGPPMAELDRARRRDRGDPPPAHGERVGPGEPHRAEPGTELRAHQDARHECCTGRPCCRCRSSVLRCSSAAS